MTRNYISHGSPGPRTSNDSSFVNTIHTKPQYNHYDRTSNASD